MKMESHLPFIAVSSRKWHHNSKGYGLFFGKSFVGKLAIFHLMKEGSHSFNSLRHFSCETGIRIGVVGQEGVSICQLNRKS